MLNSANVDERSQNWLDKLLFSSHVKWERRAARQTELRFILDRERARADRTQDGFCVIEFQSNQPSAAAEIWTHLISYLPQRLRITDDYGWMDDERLLVVLPSTNLQGAWRVADDVLNSFPDGGSVPSCEVCSYPAGWTSSDDEIGDTCGLPGDKHQPSKNMEPLYCKRLPTWKRIFDLLMVIPGILLLSPLLFILAVAIKCTSPGPVLFCQQRSGLGGSPFKIYKFRTMVADAEKSRDALLALNEQDGPAFKIRNDPRITAIGWFLRKTSLDELPQLFNVVRGDMSLVGPRPLPCHESDASEVWHRRRMDITPGITCFWQVDGRSRVTFDEWVRMDVRYARVRSLGQDLRLIVRTVITLLTKPSGC